MSVQCTTLVLNSTSSVLSSRYYFIQFFVVKYFCKPVMKPLKISSVGMKTAAFRVYNLPMLLCCTSQTLGIGDEKGE